MGTFAFNAFWRYDSGGNVVGATEPSVTDGGIFGTELSDGQADLEFTPGDTITTGSPISPYDQNGTYLGTEELPGFPGVLWVGIRFTSGDTVYFATLPNTVTGPDINNAWAAEFGAGTNGSVIEAQLDNTTQLDVVCFAAGTLIATPDGERTVETLEIGDLVTISDGRTVPVKWVGRQSMHKFFAGERACPVRISAGALGEGLPTHDLVLTGDHALIFDDLAVNASALVNGATITFDPLSSLPDRVTYFHVETEGHEVIRANGVPAESYLDCNNRRKFDNFDEYIAIYGEEHTIEEMPLPRIMSSRLLPDALRERLGIPNAPEFDIAL
ncbi:Hint domain-containing protein [Primorskyibacter sp. 2E233]|uniref:Hint domain-containing protein n=1 Tax=Primorskyibacter sp. 2E233 TaxID=3413431 RepID=UPI003BF389FC